MSRALCKIAVQNVAEESTHKGLTGEESTGSSSGSYRTALGEEYLLPKPGEVHMLQPVMFTPSLNSSRVSSIFTTAPDSPSSEHGLVPLDYAGYDSPPPANERLAGLRNERRYRLLLSHEFHPSRACFSLGFLYW